MSWPEPVERVAHALRAAAVDARLEELPRDTATAAAAAAAVGCDAGRIVKSLLFVCDGSPVLALLPGDRRADARKVAARSGAEAARVASPDEVHAVTGFEPGAVAPFALAGPVRVLVDENVLANELVWVGAGSSRHLVSLPPHELLRLAHGEPADLAE